MKALFKIISLGVILLTLLTSQMYMGSAHLQDAVPLLTMPGTLPGSADIASTSANWVLISNESNSIQDYNIADIKSVGGTCTGTPVEGSDSNYVESTFSIGDPRYTVNIGHAVAQRFKPEKKCISKVRVRGAGLGSSMSVEIRNDYCGAITASGCVPSGLPGNANGRIARVMIPASQIPQTGENTFDIIFDPPIVLPDINSYYHLVFAPTGFTFGSNSGAVITLAKKDVNLKPDIHASVTMSGIVSWYNIRDVLVFGIWYQDYDPSPPDTVPPASTTNLSNASYATKYINWTWTDPGDSDFANVSVWINGTFITNVTRGRQYFNATGLSPDTEYTISTRTQDTSGNQNSTWVNDTERTMPPDTVPPASITNLSNASGTDYIDWTWTDPQDDDFANVSIWQNGIFQTDVKKGTQHYKATNLAPDTEYAVSTRTRDLSGNMNSSWVNLTSRTKTVQPKHDNSINGYVFNDLNRNGIKDQGEQGLSGWLVKLNGYDSSAQKFISLVKVTNATGYFEFNDVHPGNYMLLQVIRPGWSTTTPSLYPLKIISSTGLMRMDFGNRKV